LNEFHLAVRKAAREIAKLGYTDEEVNKALEDELSRETKLTRALNKPFHLGLS
jgi:hypothetical protein